MPKDNGPARLFASLPPAHLSSAVAGPITALFLRQGGTQTTYTHTHLAPQPALQTQSARPAMLYFVSPPNDPAIVHLYIRTIVLYNAHWIIDSFRADKLLDLQDYVVYPWDYTGDPASIPRSLFWWHPSVSKLFKEFNVVVVPSGQGESTIKDGLRKRNRAQDQVQNLHDPVPVKEGKDCKPLARPRTPLSIGQEKRLKAHVVGH